MSEYNDTNIGIGTAYDTPEEKEIERLNQRLRTKDAISTDQAHEIYRLSLKLSAVEHERDALTTSLQSAREELQGAKIERDRLWCESIVKVQNMQAGDKLWLYTADLLKAVDEARIKLGETPS